MPLEWISWTETSKDISFKTTRKGVGDGEEKVAAELGVAVLGQNSTYDIELKIEDTVKHCDVKKLDNNTFNTGAIGRDALRPIKSKLESLLSIFKALNVFKKISPDEISVGNLKRIYETCVSLHEKRIELKIPEPKVFIDPFTSKEITLTFEAYYMLLKCLSIPLEEEFTHYIENIELFNLLQHEYIANPNMIYEDLQSLTSIFNDTILIFVDEQKGYCILDNFSTIKFERITRGNPRFRVC